MAADALAGPRTGAMLAPSHAFRIVPLPPRPASPARALPHRRRLRSGRCLRTEQPAHQLGDLRNPIPSGATNRRPEPGVRGDPERRVGDRRPGRAPTGRRSGLRVPATDPRAGGRVRGRGAGPGRPRNGVRPDRRPGRRHEPALQQLGNPPPLQPRRRPPPRRPLLRRRSLAGRGRRRRTFPRPRPAVVRGIRPARLGGEHLGRRIPGTPRRPRRPTDPLRRGRLQRIARPHGRTAAGFRRDPQRKSGHRRSRRMPDHRRPGQARLPGSRGNHAGPGRAGRLRPGAAGLRARRRRRDLVPPQSRRHPGDRRRTIRAAGQRRRVRPPSRRQPGLAGTGGTDARPRERVSAAGRGGDQRDHVPPAARPGRDGRVRGAVQSRIGGGRSLRMAVRGRHRVRVSGGDGARTRRVSRGGAGCRGIAQPPSRAHGGKHARELRRRPGRRR